MTILITSAKSINVKQLQKNQPNLILKLKYHML